MKHLKNLVIFLFLSLTVSIMFFSCFDFNFFAWGTPTSDELLDDTVDDLIYSLYRNDVITYYTSNRVEREKMIEKLSERSDGGTGEDRLKNKMAYIAVLTKTTALNLVLGANNTNDMLAIAQGSAKIDIKDAGAVDDSMRTIVEGLFSGTDESQQPEILKYAILAREALNDLGDGIRIDNNNKFPKGMDEFAVDFAEQGLMVGIISMLPSTVVPTDNDTGNLIAEPSIEDKARIVTDYISNEDSLVEFRPTTTIGEYLLGTSLEPTGTRTLLEAGGFGAAIPLIAEN